MGLYQMPIFIEESERAAMDEAKLKEETGHESGRRLRRGNEREPVWVWVWVWVRIQWRLVSAHWGYGAVIGGES